MIKVFRKIRQDLLSEGKTGKYLKYAFGEILLVVIGILIALQLNVSRENHSNQKKLNKYLSLLVEDLEKDKSSLLECIEFDSIKNQLLNQYIDSGNLKLSSETIKYAARWRNFLIHKSTYNSIQSSNILELLDNIELQNSISEYYAFAEQVNNYENTHLNTQMSNFTNEILKRKRINLLYYKDNTNIELTAEEDSIFYGYFTHIRDIAALEVRNYNKLKEELDNLSVLIKMELK
ncbi:hypothetical protein ACPX19_11260 [Winogradskyella sp. HB-48]|uniref:hypothetical protein n=1 Tax=Winogradskyella sp. HB-48 TaxID=3416808 RepID=UPI003CE97259